MRATNTSVNRALERAISLMGGPSRAAEKLDHIAPQNFSHWMGLTNRCTRIPPDHCLSIELETNGAVTRKQLRPEDWWRFWPDLPGFREARSKAKQRTS